MTTERLWGIFKEILIENGEPFEAERIGENVCILRKSGQSKTLGMLIEPEKGLIAVGSGQQDQWKQYKFDIASEDSFMDCVENVISAAAKWLNRSGVICRGDVFYARTNADLLNKFFNKKMKGYMKSIYGLTDTYALLMHVFGTVTPSGWLNREMSDGTVIAEFFGTKKIFPSHEGLPDERYRAMFEKRMEEGRFIFRGVYKLSSESTPNRRVWIKVSDETNLYDF